MGSSPANVHSIAQRFESYKFKKSKMKTVGGAPLQTKIHKTPLSKKSKYFKVSEQAKNEKFEARDPRFFAASKRESRVSGWKLRNAYRFLDNFMERDMVLIKKEIEKNKKEIKWTKRRQNEHRRDIHDWVK